MNKQKEEKIHELLNDDYRTYVITIDVGLANMAICVVDIAYAKPKLVYLEKSDLRETASGKVYDYEEAYCEELVYNWIQEHYSKYFAKAKFVCIEKQYTELKSNLERACSQIETALKSFFRVMIPFGGPHYRVVSPVVWRNLAGIQKIESVPNIPSKITNAGFQLPQRNLNYNKHKKASVDKFNSLMKEECSLAMQAEAMHFGKLSVDHIESLLFMKAILDNLERFAEEALITFNFKEDRTTGQKRFGSAKRMIDVKPLYDVQNFDFKAPRSSTASRKKQKIDHDQSSS